MPPDPKLRFFQHVAIKYGQATSKTIQSYLSSRVSAANYKEHATFNHRCKSHGVCPIGFRIKPPIKTREGYRLAQIFSRRFLSLWISICHKRIREYTRQATTLRESFSSILDSEELKLLDEIEAQRCSKKICATRTSQIAKFNRLTGTSTLCNNPATQKRKDWVVNLSSRQLSPAEESILSKGLNFAPSPSSIPTKDILVSVENSLGKLNHEEANFIRHKVSGIVKNFHPSKLRNITSVEKQAIKDLRGDSDILILPADKGRSTVVMDTSDYREKVSAMLSNTSTYRIEKRDPTPATEKKLNSILKRLNGEGKLTDAQYRHLHASGSQTPRFYGLPKIHKPDVPLRPIVSFIRSATYEVSKLLSELLSPLTSCNPYRISKVTDFIGEVKTLTVPPSRKLVSYDVISLFTSIPPSLAVTVTVEELKKDNSLQERTMMSVDDIALLLQFCLEATFFSFDGEIYRQIFGTAMGSPVSATVADIVMGHVESTALSTYTGAIPFWRRYVDDIFATPEEDEIDAFHAHINSIDKNIQFTMELEENGRLPFLDTLLERRPDGSIATSVFRKPTNTERYLDFTSHHPNNHKLSVIRTLHDRALSHVSDATERENELAHVASSLNECGYPNQFIRKTISRSRIDLEPLDPPAPPTATTVIPYVKGLTEGITRILRDHNIQVWTKPHRALRDLLVHPKDAVPIEKRSDIIYRIPCADCDKVYIGETMRRFGDRVTEHKRAVRDRNTDQSALAEHAWDSDHRIKWDSSSILDTATKWKERKIKEAVAITSCPTSMNRDSGVGFPTEFSRLLNPRN